jgi:hypothetical protein
MKTILYLSMFIIILGACSSTKVEPTVSINKIPLTGEWRYVGKYSVLADYKCLVCPEFNYDKSIYQITFNADGTFTARINLLIGKGTYTGKENATSTTTQSSGDLTITELQILNRPLETEKDSEFKDNFSKTSTFYQDIKGSNPFGYDELSLHIQKSTNYMILVRKK